MDAIRYIVAMIHDSGLTARRGTQRTRKDKDLMNDTGGATKQQRRREPNHKPPRTDVKNRRREKTLRKDEKDKDINNQTKELSKQEKQYKKKNKNHDSNSVKKVDRDSKITKTFDT